MQLTSTYALVGLLYSSFVLDFLNECGLSISAALTYLVGDISALYKYNIEEKKRVEKRRKKCLPLDFDPDEETIKVCKKLMEPVPVEQLIASQVVCKVFREAAKISLWHALKHTEPFVNCDITDNRRSSDGKMVQVQRGPKGPYGLMSYADLACSICYMFVCPVVFG